ncbi:hypothetical protein [Amycolatopsis sp. NPDC001319]|uniref:hypothetical protein n=1 Tax=unclassified Amycolatopsis TaxID=2618356 RepID=UPI0036BBE76A
MSESKSFDEAFIEFTVASGRWRDTSPAELLARWERFVTDCEHGYSSGSEDYFNDLTSRDAIERAMRDGTLSGYPEMDTFRQRVTGPDERFRVLLQPNAFPRLPEAEWWARGIVRIAGRRLVDDLRNRYGVIIDLVAEGDDSAGEV